MQLAAPHAAYTCYVVKHAIKIPEGIHSFSEETLLRQAQSCSHANTLSPTRVT